MAESLAKGLFCGEIHEDLAFPFPRPDPAERKKVDALIRDLDQWAERDYDPRKVEAEGWVGDDTIAALGEMGCLGLYVPEDLGGLGLSQTAYCRIFEAIGNIDPTLAVVLGVHQSIGMKGIHLFGTKEQKERFLPDLARGKRLAAFALTEPEAGSDAYHLKTRAVREADGAWRLDGEKRYIGNGSKDVIVAFARTDDGGHVALILEKGMKGIEVSPPLETMGLRGNDLRELRFTGVRVPPENVLGEPGDGFHVAMEVLNVGRLSLGTGAVGSTKRLLDMALRHVRDRHQFGQPLADFELVRDKLSWMTSYLYGLESMAYLTTGMVDAGVPDVAVESAMIKVAGTEFLWYAANRVFQLAGGEAYLTSRPYEKILRDIRVFTIFEGANDVMRSFIALSGLKPLGEELEELKDVDLRDPIRSLGLLAGYVEGRVRRHLGGRQVTRAHEVLEPLADATGDQAGRLRGSSERLLREHGRGVVERQRQQKRLAHAAMDLYAQIATISRVSSVLDDLGPEVAGEERFIADSFCRRAARRVNRMLDQVEDNDDEATEAIARATLRRASYGHSV